ncbi:MAG: hypothetical protein AAFY91_16720 [Bacteroidota bacterium]
MTVTPFDIILSYFETGDKPTQAQFADSLFSFRHKLDAIPAADISGLISIIDDRIQQLGGGGGVGGGDSPVFALALNVVNDDNYTIPENSELVTVVIQGGNDGIAKIGLTPGGGELFDGNITANVPSPINIGYFSGREFTVYFQGTFTAYINYLRYDQ